MSVRFLWGIKMRSALRWVLFFVIAIGALGWGVTTIKNIIKPEQHISNTVRTLGIETKTHLYSITYGLTPSEYLLFVVFHGEKLPAWDGVDSLVTVTSDSSEKRVTKIILEIPGADIINLPNKITGDDIRNLPDDVQLYEYIDGVYKCYKNNRAITYREFNEFIHSKPADYTIENLLGFIKNTPR